MNIAGEMLGAQAGITVAHVPYRGAARRSTICSAAMSTSSSRIFRCCCRSSATSRYARFALFGAERSALLAGRADHRRARLSAHGDGRTGTASSRPSAWHRRACDAWSGDPGRLRSPTVVERSPGRGLQGMLGSAAFKTRLAGDIAILGAGPQADGHQRASSGFSVCGT